MNKIVLSCSVVLIMVAPASFSMDSKQDDISCWDNLPDLSAPQSDSSDVHTTEILEDVMQRLPQYCPPDSRSLVPPLPIPLFHTTCARTVSPTAPNPLGSIEQFQRDIIASTEKLLLLQNRHIELTQLLEENSRELICLDRIIIYKLSLMKAIFNINPGPSSDSQHCLNEQFKKLLNENNSQQAAVQKIGYPLYLRQLLNIQQAAIQQFAKILQFELKEQI